MILVNEAVRFNKDVKKLPAKVVVSVLCYSKQMQMHTMNQNRFEKQAELLNWSNYFNWTSVFRLDRILLGEKWLIAKFEKCYSSPCMTAFEHFSIDLIKRHFEISKRERGYLPSMTMSNLFFYFFYSSSTDWSENFRCLFAIFWGHVTKSPKHCWP